MASYYRDLPLAIAQQGDPVSWANGLAEWFDVFNRVETHIEDPKHGGAVGGSWTQALQNAIDSIEQADPGVMGGIVRAGPRQYGFAGPVNYSNKKLIGIVGTGGRSSGIEGNRGFGGTSFYCMTSGMTLLNVDASGLAVNHWGPFWERINFNSVDFQNTTLVKIQNTNHFALVNCSFNYGLNQLVIDARIDLSAAGDASYGYLANTRFAHYSGRGVLLTSGQVKAYDTVWFNDLTGGWGVEVGGYAANAEWFGGKFDSPGGGIWDKGYANDYYGFGMESTNPGFRLDKDAAVAFSGHHRNLYGIKCTGHAGTEVGIDHTTSAGYDFLNGYVHQGLATPIADSSGKLMVVTAADAAGEPLIKLPNRTGDPATPVSGAVLYALGGVLKTRDATGAIRSL